MFPWSEHSSHCNTCNKRATVAKGGRPKKQPKNRGRPKQNSCQNILQHVLKITPPTLYDDDTSFQLHPLPMNVKPSDVKLMQIVLENIGQATEFK